MSRTSVIGPDRLLEFRFGLRSLFVLVTGFAVFCALCPWIEYLLPIFLTVFASISFCILVWTMMMTPSNTQNLGRLTGYQLAVAACLFFGPILSYHVNGRAGTTTA